MNPSDLHRQHLTRRALFGHGAAGIGSLALGSLMASQRPDPLAPALPHIQGVRVLDVGCGPADIPIAIANARPHWQILAVDASSPPTCGQSRIAYSPAIAAPAYHTAAAGRSAASTGAVQAPPRRPP